MKCEDCKKEVKEVWPKDGDNGYILYSGSSIDSSPAIYVDYALYPLGFYKTKEDAQIMCDWYKAQQLDWMPDYEECDNWFCWDGFNQAIDLIEKPYYRNISIGNVHKTKEDAMEYGKLMEKVGEIKRKYYKLKYGL